MVSGLLPCRCRSIHTEADTGSPSRHSTRRPTKSPFQLSTKFGQFCVDAAHAIRLLLDRSIRPCFCMFGSTPTSTRFGQTGFQSMLRCPQMIASGDRRMQLLLQTGNQILNFMFAEQ